MFTNLPTQTYLHFSSFFFFNDTATTEIYTLSLHDALPILIGDFDGDNADDILWYGPGTAPDAYWHGNHGHRWRSEEHTSELQSLRHLVCRLLLEKKKKNKRLTTRYTMSTCGVRHSHHVTSA